MQKTGLEAKAIKQRINTRLIHPPANASGAQLPALSSTDLAQQNP